MKVYPAVFMYISCSSRTSACRSGCKKVMLRDMKKDNNMDSTFTTCPGCNEDLSVDIRMCCLCGVSTSPSWYTVNSQDVCNACYLYQRKYNAARPINPRASSSSSSKVYHPHFQCGWKLKFVVYSDNLKLWKIYTKTSNDDYHQDPVIEITKKRPSLSTRDLWDQLRVLTKA
ncbi:hypothetical protein Pcinc_012332 [Petrolisthes cinctipes]|uniref:GATA-type domain-containing protein n=1 Tax=Petrolisthes cinctipes TaxID=88211 RepID=A0AAE1G129_PETCI|nr:hypothetical protein Pcinc_012332 [Petrolisthes cinctipes]